MSTTKTSAIVPWLGYKSQEYRLVQRLLKADNSSYLGFELLDDVDEYNEHSTVLEQDKISVTRRNIVSNNSVDLWKTLSNWIDLIKENQVDPLNTKYLLYTNKQHSSEILELLINATDESSALSAFNKIKDLVKEPSETIKSYVNNFFDSAQISSTLIENFDYIYGSGSAPNDLKIAYIEKRLGAIEDNVDEILFEILGWTGDFLTIAAENRKPTIISAKSFGERLGSIESKYRQKTILNYICNRNGDSEDVMDDLNSEPTYIEQLKLIETDELDIEEAVIAKLEASDAVLQWTIDGHVQESSYKQYQNSLRKKWHIQKQRILLDSNVQPQPLVGARIYYECLDSVDSIELEHKRIDDFFSHGTLQTMADELTIGWHPDYKTILRGCDD